MPKNQTSDGETTVVRSNLMEEEGYTPYCAVGRCMMRLRFNGAQFECCEHDYVTGFPEDFIKRYKEKWNI